MGLSAPHVQSQVYRHRANWRGLVVVLVFAVVIALVGVSRMDALLRDLLTLSILRQVGIGIGLILLILIPRILSTNCSTSRSQLQMNQQK